MGIEKKIDSNWYFYNGKVNYHWVAHTPNTCNWEKTEGQGCACLILALDLRNPMCPIFILEKHTFSLFASIAAPLIGIVFFCNLNNWCYCALFYFFQSLAYWRSKAKLHRWPPSSFRNVWWFVYSSLSNDLD